MTQEKIAEELGVEEKTVSSWECGRIQAPDPSLWKDISRILDIPISEIYTSAFDEEEHILISHVVKKEELEKRFCPDDWPFDGGFEPFKTAYMAEHSITDENCWDYKLMITRQEIEVCLFYQQVYPDMDIFEVEPNRASAIAF